MYGGRDRQRPAGPRSARDTAALLQIFKVLRAAFGVDFSEYNAAPFERRVAGRMGFQGTAALPDYAALLLDDPKELGLLYDDVLTHVTSFFRDPAAFEVLAGETLPAILSRKHAKRPVRVWAAGCATGEEVYSLAILLLESMGGDARHVQVIGTDVSHAAVTKARLGAYSDTALANVSADRRERYFVPTADGGRVSETVHDLCSFFQHDLARDPPLAQVDLVSCRNVVMYFDPQLQKRVLERFHYALKQPGFLLLGSAEGVSGSRHLFSSVNEKGRVFARKATASALGFSDDDFGARSTVHRHSPQEVARPPGLARYLDRTLLTRYVPPGVLINDKMQVLEFRGQTGAFLELTPGTPSYDIILMLRQALRSPLLAAIARAKDQIAPVRVRGLQVHRDGATTICDLVVSRLVGVPNAPDDLFTVIFEPTMRTTAPKRKGKGEDRVTRDDLRSIVDEHDRTTGDLRAANVDLTSRNAELQSINDDLRDRLAVLSEGRND
jgi:two-component system CheB/CheR fusion protein